MRKIRGRPGAELIGATGQAQLHLLYLAVPLITGCRQQHCADSGAGWLMSLILYSTGTGVVYIGHSAVVGMPWPVDQEFRVSGTPSLGNGMSRGHLGRGCCAELADSSFPFVARTLNQHTAATHA